MKTIKNHYFKDNGTRPFDPLMSGLPLPLSESGMVVNTRFEDCEFHPECSSDTFVNCEFVGCRGDIFLTKEVADTTRIKLFEILGTLRRLQSAIRNDQEGFTSGDRLATDKAVLLAEEILK